MLAVIFVFLGVLLRLIPHPPNMAPITALALFGGANLNKRYAIVVPLAAMFISDYFIGFHGLMPWVYGSFASIGLIGIWLKRKKSPRNLIGASLTASLIFYLITNFGVWLEDRLYPPTLNGLFMSYYMAVPFFRNTIIGDLFYTGVFFGAYELAQMVVKKWSHLGLSVLEDRRSRTED